MEQWLSVLDSISDLVASMRTKTFEIWILLFASQQLFQTIENNERIIKKRATFRLIAFDVLPSISAY